MSAPNEAREVELKDSHWQYLERMMNERGLPDLDKALRCLVNHAIDRSDLEGEIFDEIRCDDC